MSNKDIKELPDEGWIKDRYELIIKELQSVLAFGYVLLVILGMVLEFGYYDAFGVNIFEYSVIGDFLLAPFRRPISLALLIIIGAYLLVAYPVDKWLAKKFPKLYRVLNFGLVRANNSTRYRNLMFGITGFLLIFLFAMNIGLASKKSLAKFPDNIKVHFSNTQTPLSGVKVGQTSTYLFLLDSTNQVKVIPIASNVLWIEEL